MNVKAEDNLAPLKWEGDWMKKKNSCLRAEDSLRSKGNQVEA